MKFIFELFLGHFFYLLRSDLVAGNLVKDETALWPRHTVPVELGDSLDDKQRQHMQRLFFMFHAQTCVRFVSRRKEPDYLVIEVGDWRTLLPPVGRRGDRQVLTFTPKDFEMNRVILRDLLRTLGFYYEIQRPDRFMFVNVQTKNILTKDWSKFRVLKEGEMNLLGESYDYNSATHFSPDEFAASTSGGNGTNNASFTVLAPNNQRTGQDEGLSEIDIRRIIKAYKCQVLVSDNNLCPEKWVAGEDGQCYYFSFLDPASKSIQGPGRQSCERMLSIPLVMRELSIPARSFVLDTLRQSRIDSVWVIGSDPSRDLKAERDSRCSVLDMMNNVRSLENCEETIRNFTCQRTAANECWFVRDNKFLPYPQCKQLLHVAQRK